MITIDLMFGFLIGLSCGAMLSITALLQRRQMSVASAPVIGCARTDDADVKMTPQTTPVRARVRRDVLVPMKSAQEHAEALLSFLQGPGGLVGELTATEIEASYSDLMIDLAWHPRPWPTIAKALRSALGNSRKTYGYRNGHRVRIWKIPPATKTPVPLRRAA
ncbi:MAG: hypothetical protein AB7S74_07365 [Hyphomicrobium sp.]